MRPSHQGTIGRWRDVLTRQDLAMYDTAARREVDPDCRAWLENGRLAAGRSSG